MLDCILPVVSPVSIGEGTSQLIPGSHTSRTMTTRPSARPHKSLVIWANPEEVTLHSPSGSPSAASNPAETGKIGGRMRYMRRRSLTENNFRSKLFCNRHYHPFKRVKVVSVAFPALGPGDINRTDQEEKHIVRHEGRVSPQTLRKIQNERENQNGRYTQAESSTLSLRGIASRGIIGVEGRILIPVYRDIQHVGVLFKCGLNTVTLGGGGQ